MVEQEKEIYIILRITAPIPTIEERDRYIHTFLTT
jgi:hypothetical protein